MLLDDLTACDRELTEHQNTLRDKTDDHEQKVSQLRSLQDENYALNIHASLESLKINICKRSVCVKNIRSGGSSRR